MLIETILAAFEMDEILYELREHSAGLNCGRWDYIFSFIKKLAADTSVLLPDRSQVTMTTHFMRSYSKLCIKTCHRRGVHAMGGMAALIPIKYDPEANERALAQVRADKEREASDGHDGTWVAHPGLVPIAIEVFDRLMPAPTRSTSNSPTTTSPPPTCSKSPPAPSPKPASSRTSPSASATSKPGCAASAASRSSTSWKTPPPPRSPARSSGSGCTTAPSYPTAQTPASPSPPHSATNTSTPNSPAQARPFLHIVTRPTSTPPFSSASSSSRPKFQDFLTVPAYARILDREIYTA